MFKKQNIVLIIILTISFSINLFNVVNLPIFYDEAWTYLNFTEKGFLYSISNYPAPNNHILHSVFTIITKNLPFGTTVNLRIPNLILATITSILFFITFSKIFTRKIALYLLPIFCFLFVTMHYAYLSRGYMLVLFSFILCFYTTIQLLNKENKEYKKYHFIFLFGSVIGFYTMPSFLYPYITCTSFLFLYYLYYKDFKNIKVLIFFCSTTILLVLFLYTPVFFVSGIDAVFNNRFVEPKLMKAVLLEIPGHFKKTIEFLVGFKFLFPLIIFLIGLYLLTKYKDVNYFFAMYCFILAPLILCIHRVIPFYRTWIYLIIPLLFIIGFIIKHNKFSTFKITCLISVISIFLIINFCCKIKKEQQFSYFAVEVFDKIKKINPDNVYIFHHLIEINLQYLVLENNKSIKIEYVSNEYHSKYLVPKNDCFITSKVLENENKFLLTQNTQ